MLLYFLFPCDLTSCWPDRSHISFPPVQDTHKPEWTDPSWPRLWTCVGRQYEKVRPGFIQPLNPGLLQWSCSKAGGSDCGRTGQLPAVSLCECEHVAFLKERAVLTAEPHPLTKPGKKCALRRFSVFSQKSPPVLKLQFQFLKLKPIFMKLTSC